MAVAVEPTLGPVWHCSRFCASRLSGEHHTTSLLLSFHPSFSFFVNAIHRNRIAFVTHEILCVFVLYI